MKSVKEIFEMLTCELLQYKSKDKPSLPKSGYYNSILGSTSFLLAALLEELLKQNYSEWDRRKWIDDSLITSIGFQNNTFIIEGVMIWGKTNTTKQWVDLFSFKLDLVSDEDSSYKFTFLFCDLDMCKTIYEDYKNNREHIAYKTRRWKYIIKGIG